MGLAASGRRGLPWAVFTLGFTTLTLGPFVQLDATPPLPEWSSHTPLPYYALYNELPFFAKAYRPYRIGVLSLMCLSALGAVGLAALSSRARCRRPRPRRRPTPRGLRQAERRAAGRGD